MSTQKVTEAYRSVLLSVLGKYYDPAANRLLTLALAVVVLGLTLRDVAVLGAGIAIIVILLVTMYRNEQRWRA